MDPVAQPGADAAPVAPVVPVEAAPVAPEAPAQADEGQSADDAEWDSAADDMFPGLKFKKKEGEEDESAESKEDPKTAEAPKTGDPEETPEQKAEREQKEADDAAAGSEDDEVLEEDVSPETAARAARIAARESAQQVEAVKTDIRTQMFADVPQVLQDADGDPIKGIGDVMKLINPRTGVAFTEEEAGMWLLSAQQQFNQNLASTEKQIEAIADTNMDLKDQADNINFTYGELLKAMPELRDEIWADYQETLIKDSKSGIIVKAPISLQKFYERALKPYADKALQLEQAAANDPAPAPAPAVPPVKTEADAKLERDKKRADRSDIFGGGKDPVDAEDAEWGQAAIAVFGPRK